MKTAAAYIRVSDERQDEFSPDSQLKLIREYCKKNDIVIVCDSYYWSHYSNSQLIGKLVEAATELIDNI